MHLVISRMGYYNIRRVLKSSRPSLPLKKAPTFSSSLSSIVFATLSVPLTGDRNLKGWLGVLTQQSCDYLSAGALSNLLIACRFSAFFLVVSIKKRTFAEKFNVSNYRLWQH